MNLETLFHLKKTVKMITMFNNNNNNSNFHNTKKTDMRKYLRQFNVFIGQYVRRLIDDVFNWTLINLIILQIYFLFYSIHIGTSFN